MAQEKPARYCRDCTRCTESSFKRAVASPVRVVLTPFTALANMFRRTCRVCDHPLAWHPKIDGRFTD